MEQMTGIGLATASEKASEFRLFSVARSVAALTTVQVVIHYRSPSSPATRTLQKTKKATTRAAFLVLVRVTGLEPAQPCDHKNLNLTRLPIPPHPHMQLSPIKANVIISYLFRFVKCFLRFFEKNYRKSVFWGCLPRKRGCFVRLLGKQAALTPPLPQDGGAGRGCLTKPRRCCIL